MQRKLLKQWISVGLSSTIAFAGIGFAVSSVLLPGQTEAAAATATHSSYDQFEQRLKKPSTLGWAKATLINNIDEFSLYQATIATLHLENAQKAYLPTAQQRIEATAIQNDINKVYEPGMTMNTVRSKVTSSKTKIVLQDLNSIGYKLETSEGMFYPVMDYKSFKVFKPYVKPDIQAYIDLMATESQQPSTADAALRIGWDEVLERTLAKEAFLTKYKSSNRTAAVKEAFVLSRMYTFYGTSNTPLFDYDSMTINPEAKAAYEKALTSKTSSEIKASGVLTELQEFLKLLDQSDDTKTQAINDFLKGISS
ncbi:hypothetical protein [Paenibacillus segetis]|uniref:Uncharacterized protein n=1 Tax=Paenibacillus segetis TaxID=1325360 RepID=A0ABQ1Y706_9BACL|nr:hypothetical protein [Paenibacillus segetis]GGH15042.1 hypothetical protein GCM10008013_09040 [Paenibacillus segetis]